MNTIYETITDMRQLPHNTKFYVKNGAWTGKIIHKDDGVYIQTTTNDSACLNGENQFKTTGKEELYINLLNEDVELFCEDIECRIMPMLDEEFLNGRYGIDILEEYIEKKRAEVKANIEKREKSKMK